MQSCSHLTLSKPCSGFSVLGAPPEMPARILILAVLEVCAVSLPSRSHACPNRVSVKPCSILHNLACRPNPSALLIAP